MKLRGKLAIAFTFIIVLNIVLAGVIYYDISNTTSNLDKMVESTELARADIEVLMTNLDNIDKDQTELNKIVYPFQEGLVSGKIDLATVDIQFLQDMLSKAINVLSGTYTTTENADSRLSSIEQTMDSDFIALNKDTTSMADNNLRLIIILNSVTAVIAILIALILSGVIVTPIRKLTAVANQIGEGNINVEIPDITSKDEVRDLAYSIETMRGAIKTLKNENPT